MSGEAPHHVPDRLFEWLKATVRLGGHDAEAEALEECGEAAVFITVDRALSLCVDVAGSTEEAVVLYRRLSEDTELRGQLERAFLREVRAIYSMMATERTENERAVEGGRPRLYVVAGTDLTRRPDYRLEKKE